MKLRNWLTAAAFILTLVCFSLGQLLLPDKEISVTERRPLEQAPAVTIKSIADGSYGEQLERYLLDQFPLRDPLRRLKAFWQFQIYRQSDNNDIYLLDNQILKLDPVLKEDEVTALIDNTNRVYQNHLQGMQVSFALIPDKNFFAAQANGYPALDYEQMEQLLSQGLNSGIGYLGMEPFAQLTLDDYYTTDLHWKQEQLQSVVNALSQALDFTPMDLSACERTEYAPFYGAYYGQSALSVPPDTITTLTNETIDNSVVTGPEVQGEKPVYHPKDFVGLDGYNVFTGGPMGLVTLTNPTGTTGKELIIFRDSFASSLAPLLLEGYDRITLVDLRYLMSIHLDQLVEFKDQDVLFLYSTTIVNSGKLLK